MRVARTACRRSEVAVAGSESLTEGAIGALERLAGGLEAGWRSWTWQTWVPLLPPLVLVALIHRWGVDVPFWDQWEMVPHLASLYAGDLELLDLWRLHNEHRPLVPKLIMLSLATLTGWNIRVEMMVSALLATGTLLVMVPMLVESPQVAGRRFVRGLVPVLSMLVFGLAQVENWSWGWQIQIFLGVFALCCGVRLLTAPRSSGPAFSAAMALGWVATYSFATGVLYWLVTLPLVGGERPTGLARPGRRRRTLWLVSAACCWLTYYPIPEEMSPTWTWQPLQLGHYAVTYLGASISSRPAVAAIAGALGLLALLLLAALDLDRCRTLMQRRALLAWLALATYATASALLTAAGRAHLGVEQALSSRYVTISQLLWIALLVLAARWAASSTLRQRAFIVGAFVLFVHLAAGSARSASRFVGQYRYKSEAVDALMRDLTRPEVARLHPDPELVRERLLLLQAYRLSLYRSAPMR